ncbi:hypothetical protein [Nocardioides yefusunii]|uniref:Uncharacterized protein n=1 Tax=Nocardioides yefusunii TaxID=2500546 RepID=A0ABW1QSJ7_9ACTN|nr:hypothetical protein [Nocardioides yefusunii]
MSILATLLDPATLQLGLDVLRAAEYDSYDTDDDGGILLLLALGPAGAGLVYWSLYRYYRNTDKSHDFERETTIEAQPVTGGERKVGDRNGTTSSSIDNANGRAHRKRVNRFS